jgi:hypothetical protein
MRLIATLGMITLCATCAFSQIAQNDIVLGTSTDEGYDGPTMLHLTPDADCLMGPPAYTVQGAWADQGDGDGRMYTYDPTDPDWLQGIEFDNYGFISHNAAGNLLAVDFGGSWDGLFLVNVATDGTANYQELWGLVGQTDGQMGTAPGDWYSQRGTGLSISPCNDKIAVSPSYDAAVIYVLDYDPGLTPGTGAGAWVGGPRVTGGFPMAGGNTSNTAWFDNNTLLFLNSAKQVGVWYVGDVPPGTDASEQDAYDDGDTWFSPTVDSGWMVVNTQLITAISGGLQVSDIEYCPECDPDHVYCGITTLGYAGYLARFTIDRSGSNITLRLDGLRSMPAPHEPREIGFSSCCELYWSNYAGSGNSWLVSRHEDPIDDFMGGLIAVVPGASDPQYTPWTGMDVARSMPLGGGALVGDLNDDCVVNDDDLGALLGGFGTSGPVGDLNNDGIVNDDDLGILLGAWGTECSGPDCDPAELDWYLYVP